MAEDFPGLDPATQIARGEVEEARLARSNDPAAWARWRHLIEQEKVARLEEAIAVKNANRRALEQRGLFNLLQPSSGGIVRGADTGRVASLESALESEFAGNLVRGASQAELSGMRAKERFMAQRQQARYANEQAKVAGINALIKNLIASGVSTGHLIQKKLKRPAPGTPAAPEQTGYRPSGNPQGFSVTGEQAWNPLGVHLGSGNYASQLGGLFDSTSPYQFPTS